jgi:hypothetical protein
MQSIAQRHGNRLDDDKVIPWSEGNGLWGSLNSLVADLNGVDVITFFAQNPYACDSAEGVATRIGREAHKLEPVLDKLVAAGFLRAIELGDLRVYAMAEDAHHRQTLQQYVTWLREGYHWARMVMDRDR